MRFRAKITGWIIKIIRDYTEIMQCIHATFKSDHVGCFYLYRRISLVRTVSDVTIMPQACLG